MTRPRLLLHLTLIRVACTTAETVKGAMHGCRDQSGTPGKTATRYIRHFAALERRGINPRCLETVDLAAAPEWVRQLPTAAVPQLFIGYLGSKRSRCGDCPTAKASIAGSTTHLIKETTNLGKRDDAPWTGQVGDSNHRKRM